MSNRRLTEHLICRVYEALASGQGIFLGSEELLALTDLLREQTDQAAAHEAMLHTFVHRAYGQNSVRVH